MENKLQTTTAEKLMDMKLPPLHYAVDKLLSCGVNIIAGSPKVGKSWLMLWMADRISRGLPLWGFECEQCDVLYLALEDNYTRLQKRLTAITGGETGRIHIATSIPPLGKGFEEQLNTFLDENPDVGFVIIDTLQVIRSATGESYSYQADYNDMHSLKEIAGQKRITILAVHHTRKSEATDAFNMISGTNGIMGSADGAMVLKKGDRGSNRAMLYVTGRDAEDMSLTLEFDKSSSTWKCIGTDAAATETFKDSVLESVATFIALTGIWRGSATELAEELRDFDGTEISPNALSRRLNTNYLELERDYNFHCTFHRSKDAKQIEIRSLFDIKDCLGDGDDI